MILISNIILLILVSNLPPSLGRLGPNSNIENGQTHRELQSSICDQFPWNDDERVKNICIAYCDNCLIEPRPSCDRLKYKLIKATGNSVFPCENRCPCWDEEDLQVLDATNVHQLSCINLHPGYPYYVPPVGAYIQTGSSGWHFGASGNFWTINGAKQPACIMKVQNLPPPDEATALTDEELQTCIDEISNRCEELGLGYTGTILP